MEKAIKKEERKPPDPTKTKTYSRNEFASRLLENLHQFRSLHQFCDVELSSGVNLEDGENRKQILANR